AAADAEQDRLPDVRITSTPTKSSQCSGVELVEHPLGRANRAEPCLEHGLDLSRLVALVGVLCAVGLGHAGPSFFDWWWRASGCWARRPLSVSPPRVRP